MSTSYDAFETKVKNALSKIRKQLDSHKQQPVVASAQSHTYDDKFLLAQTVTGLAIASLLGTLESLGAPRDELKALAARAAASGQTITLKLTRSDTCKLLRHAKREVPSDTKVETTSSLFGSKSETRVVQTVHEYHWAFGHSHDLILFAGASADDPGAISLSRRQASVEIVTLSERAPRPETSANERECDVTWLVSQLRDGPIDVSIDRSDASCLTPRRNPTVDAALEALEEIGAFLLSVQELYRSAQAVESLDASEEGRSKGRPLTPFDGGFAPVLPILQPPSDDAKHASKLADGDADLGGDDGPVAAPPAELVVAEPSPAAPAHAAVGSDVLNGLLRQEVQARQARLEALAAAHPPASEGGRLASAEEARLAFLAHHGRLVAVQYREAVEYVEGLLRNQLVAAVGRELTPSDFAAYMVHHNKKLYRAEHAPQPFCFAVRMPGRSPEGVVSIEAPAGGATAGESAAPQPVHTVVRHTEAHCPPMSFALDAATRVLFHGDRHLHAYLDHQFASSVAKPLTLSVRARQFSCFMVLLGRLGPNGTFEPTHGMVARNRDELHVPLMLEQLPSAKEFDDAIASLSPEQQRFAKAYRSMQLEGSVFGLLVVQLKPQLEKLLKLPPDSLTKEIQLTQQLLELFIQYQIPSDLLAYDGDAAAPTADKLAAVRGHVKAIYDTIGDAKQSELEGAKLEHAYAHPGAALAADRRSVSSDEECDEEDDAPTLRGGGGFRCGGKGGGGKGGGGLLAASEALMSEARCFKKGASAPRRAMPSMRCASAPSAPPLPPPPPAGGPPPPKMKQLASPQAAPPQALQSAMNCASHAAAEQQAALRPSAEQEARDVDSFGALERSEEGGAKGAGDRSEQAGGKGGGGAGGAVDVGREDYTRLPGELDAKLRSLDPDGEVRPTKIKVGASWMRRSAKGLLAKPTEETVGEEAQRREKQKCFDLLDALSLSGALPLDCASLHVILAATHCFDESLLNTVIARNVNPIEKLERSSLIVGETIHALPAPRLVRPEAYDAVAMHSAPMLLPPRDGDEGGDAM